MTLYIKKMVCVRCIMAVRRELDRQGLNYKNIQLGEVELIQAPTKEQLEHFTERLAIIGFELLDDKKSRIVEKIKNIIVSLIHRKENDLNMKLSALFRSSDPRGRC